jgi:hypothetical protein
MMQTFLVGFLWLRGSNELEKESATLCSFAKASIVDSATLESFTESQR